MYRKTLLTASALVAVAVSVIAWPASANAYSGPGRTAAVDRALKANHMPVWEVRCITGTSLANMTGSRSTLGLTLAPAAGWPHVFLHENAVCKPITAYATSGDLYNTTVDAYVTIGHEAAHFHGIHNEREAECAGVRFAYSYLGRIGAYRTYTRSGVRATLLDDSGRPPAYKLRGTCAL